MPPKIKTVGKYELGITLGQGTFGKVKMAIDRSSLDVNGSPMSYAIKLLDKSKIRSAGLGAQIKKEIRVMKALNHPTCIKLVEVLASKTTIFLVCELVSGGELFDRIVADGRFDESTARKYFIQLMEGLAHCHSLGICHRDLKPENLLLDAFMELKISDFGLAALNENLDEPQILHTACGTPNYVAPEVLMEKGYDGEAADIWSAGVILYVLLAGFLPFDEANMVDLFRKIVCADFQYPSWISAEAQTLISRMLEPDPDRRARMSEIQQSSFFRGISREELDLEEEEADEGKAPGKRRLSHFFNEDLLKDDTKDDSGLSAELVNAPVERIDHENHKVVVKGVELSTVEWFGAKYPGRRSTTTQGKGKGKGRKSLRKQQLEAGIISSPSMSSSASTTSSAPIGVSGLSLTLSQSLMRKMDEKIEGCPTTPQGPGSGISESTGPSTDKVLMPVAEEDGEERDAEDEEPVDPEEERSGPRPLNAFDLINMVSGQSMNNMLLFNKGVQSQGQPSFTQFTSRLPTDALMKRIDYVLLSIPRIRYRICTRKCQVSLVWTSPKNHRIGAHIEVYNLTNSLHMVQCKRMHGSILAHHELYKRLRDDMKANENDVPLEAVRARLAEWESDYPIFAEAYQHRHKGPKPVGLADTSAKVADAEAVAEAVAEISAAPASACPVPIGSLRAGLSNMRSLTARKPAPPASTTSSSDDDDTDNESETSSVASPPATGNRRLETAEMNTALRSLRVADDTAMSRTGLQAPELSRTRSNSTQPRIESNSSNLGSSNTLKAQAGPIIP